MAEMFKMRVLDMLDSYGQRNLVDAASIDGILKTAKQILEEIDTSKRSGEQKITADFTEAVVPIKAKLAAVAASAKAVLALNQSIIDALSVEPPSPTPTTPKVVAFDANTLGGSSGGNDVDVAE
ncbi:MAG: hypothetical protein WCW01_05130 [Gammaproteobacteria bacterium]